MLSEKKNFNKAYVQNFKNAQVTYQLALLGHVFLELQFLLELQLFQDVLALMLPQLYST